MRARVIYESMFGNTAAIAAAIAQGLGEHAEVEILSVAAAAATPDPTIDLLVVGGPTHVFGLSRARTRSAADAQTDSAVVVDIGIREWLDAALPVPRGHTSAAAFGTKAAEPSWLPGSAAHGVGKRLQHLGYGLAVDPMDFLVEGTKGPLLDGELERARAWAERLARIELDRIEHRV